MFVLKKNHPDFIPILERTNSLYYVNQTVVYILSETLAEGRSKVKDSQKYEVPVVEKDFLVGVKTEGVVSMLKQFQISEWGNSTEKIHKARTLELEKEKKSGGKLIIMPLSFGAHIIFGCIQYIPTRPV